MGILSAILPIANTVLDRVIPNKNARAKAKELFKQEAQDKEHELEVITAKTQQDIVRAQGKINLAEARSKDPFTSRARPAMLWVCVIAMAMMLIVMPLVAYIADWCVLAFGWEIPQGGLPVFISDSNAVYGIALPLLGLGTMRTVEKIKGVARAQS